MAAQILETTLTIPNAGTTSEKLAIGPFRAGSIQLPGAMTGITLAVQVSNDDVNYTEVLETAPETNPFTPAANAVMQIPFATFRSKFMRLVSGAAEGAARVFKVFLKD